MEAQIDRFRGPKSIEIDEKCLLKSMLFLIAFLDRFCVHFGRVWEGFEAPRAKEKGELSGPKSEVDGNLALGSFLGGFGKILGHFWEGVGRSWDTLGWSWEALGMAFGRFGKGFSPQEASEASPTPRSLLS